MRALLFILSIGFCANLGAVINNGIINFDPVPGASGYTLWKVPPGQGRYELLARFTAPPFVVPGATADYSTFYVRSVSATNINGVSVNIESDYGFVVTPPAAAGTNTVRLIGPVSALLLQSADNPAGPWTDVGLFTNTVLRLAPRTNQFLRTLRTNLPPPFPQ
jgi:hypothetical protein